MFDDLVSILPARVARECVGRRSDGASGRPVKISRARLAVFATEQEAAVRALLQDLSPEAALPHHLPTDSDVVRRLDRLTVLNRIAWVIGSMATGRSTAATTVSGSYEALGAWWAAVCLAQLGEPGQDLTAAIASREFLHRTTSQIVRYSWVTRDICDELVREVGASEVAREAVPELTATAVEELLERTGEYILRGGEAVELSAEARALALTLAVRHGESSGKSLQAVMESRDVDTHPWVVMPNGEPAPVALRSAGVSLDLSLIDLLDRRLRGSSQAEVSKGELFERVAESCMARALRIDRTSSARPLRARVSKTDEGEVDIALGREKVELIGECKAMTPTRPASGTSGGFEQQVGKAVQQLHKRLSALRSGRTLVDAAGRTYEAAGDVVGVGVVLHAYGGALLDPEALDLMPTDEVTQWPVVVADLHAWVAIMQGLRGVDELRDYLRFRGTVMRQRLVALDELDLFVMYLNPRVRDITRGVSVRIAAGEEAARIVSGTTIPLRTALTTPRPASYAGWRRAFYDAAEVL